MPTHSVHVLNAWFSMFGMRVLVALKLKGVEYEYYEEDLQNKSKLLLESNPIHKKIPVLIHDGKPVCESLIIVQYIDEAWPSSDKPILPIDPYKRAIARFWADYVDKKMYEAGSRIIKSPAGEEREQAKKDFIEVLQTLDGALREVSDGGPYFGGQEIGFVDVALAPFLCWFEAYETLGEFKIWDASKCPHLHKWADTVLDHPSVKEAISIAPPPKIVELLTRN
uniref:glutathione transferase n=1 Tax=Pteris vittata TaxID=13821 RepID=A0A8T8BE04_PTEVI|nr:glutathione S-transferase 2 [Pteris vittata]